MFWHGMPIIPEEKNMFVTVLSESITTAPNIHLNAENLLTVFFTEELHNQGKCISILPKKEL